MDKSDIAKIRVKELFRSLMIPLSSDSEETIVGEINSIYNSFCEVDEVPILFEDHIRDWTSGNKCSPELKEVIKSALAKTNHTKSDVWAANFLSMFDKIDVRLVLPFNRKLVLFSYIPLIVSLLDEYKMSCAKIAYVLTHFDNRLEYITWREIQVIAGVFGIKPQLDLDSVKYISEIDKVYQNHLFADANIDEASLIVAEKANELGYKGNLLGSLVTLSGNIFYPYIQIIHYQALISEFYDHRVSVIYEFSPRGDIPSWVFNSYENVATGNPFLNNAKAVENLDYNWANSRKSNIPQAFALVEVLSNIDLMNYNSSNELCAWLRRWIYRLLELKEEPQTTLTPFDSKVEVLDFLNRIESTETNTYGVIEQRVVDFVTVDKYSNSNRRSRGIGDSVHANNLSKSKLGDCDFQDIENLSILAYEAHAGILTKNYLDSHMKTLPRLIERRTTEMENIGDLKDWTIEIWFVAHKLESHKPIEIVIDNINVLINQISYHDFYHSNKDILKLKTFNLLVIEALNRRNTPNYVRENFVSIKE